MKKYYRHNIALNDEEEARLKSTGKGVTEIFKAMLDALCPIVPVAPTEQVAQVEPVAEVATVEEE